MFLYLYNGFGIHIKFETKRGSLVFLTGSCDQAVFKLEIVKEFT